MIYHYLVKKFTVLVSFHLRKISEVPTALNLKVVLTYFTESTNMKNEKPTPNEDRRSFLKKIGGATASTVTLGAFAGTASAQLRSEKSISNRKRPSRVTDPRPEKAFRIRVDAAQGQFDQPLATHSSNGDETRYPSRIGNFTKTLPHNNLGEVDPTAYDAFLAAIASGNPNDYNSIPMGGTVKLTNPQAGVSFQMEGADGNHMGMPAPAAIGTTAANGEILEVYWQAVTRDIPFDDYRQSRLIGMAIRELRLFPAFDGVSRRNIFRGETTGDRIGNYVSQFLLKPIPYGATTIEQRYRVPLADDNKVTDFTEWLNIQNGLEPSVGINYDPTPRYIRNGRDLGEFVHQDFSYQAYLNAALIMLGWGNDALSDTNPYHTVQNQAGFVQFGPVHVLDMVSRVALAALKCAWFQKWNVHRRLRPEVYASLIHKQATGMTDYGLNTQIENSRALRMIFDQYGTYLLPMAYPEGSPTHPAYPAGHATVAGACTTILKAFFNENFVIPNPVRVGNDGQSLESYNGRPLRIGDEVNKLAANISLGRDIAGVHWRADGIEGIFLGEKVAIAVLKDYKQTYNESFGGFTFTKYDGTSITI